MNGDGYSDLIIGEPRFGEGRGRALVYLGSPEGLKHAPFFIAEGENPGRYFAENVAFMGDINGDGIDEVLVRSGGIYFGGKDNFERNVKWLHAQVCVPLGDVNGDGFDDIAVHTAEPNSEALDLYRVIVYHGSREGLKDFPDWSASSEQSGSHFAHDVAAAGDVNGDGFDDLLVGAMKFSGRYVDSGKAYLYLGSKSGLGSAPAWASEYPIEPEQGVDELKEQFFSHGLAGAGDVNGDGFDDVAVGACFAERGDRNEGMAFLFLGSRAGLPSHHAWFSESNHPHTLFGQTLSVSGDFNGDGFADVVVGAPQAMNGQQAEGAVVAYFGSHSGPSRWPVWSMESDHSHLQLGEIVQSAGDINGDGYSDVLLVGSLRKEDPTDGHVEKLPRYVVVFGGPTGFTPSHDWKLKKPFLVAANQEFEAYRRRFGSAIYWGPGILFTATAMAICLGLRSRHRRLRISQELQRERAVAQERARIADDFHDDLGAELTRILFESDAVLGRAGKGDVTEHVERLRSLTHRAFGTVRDLVWTTDPTKDSLAHVATYLSEFIASFCQSAGIECCLDFPEELPPAPIKAPFRHQLILAAKEVLNNVARHSKATTVLANLHITANSCELSIQDNGVGFQLASPEKATPADSTSPKSASRREASGRGLSNLSKRMNAIGGSATIESTPGQGTTVVLRIPLALNSAQP